MTLKDPNLYFVDISKSVQQAIKNGLPVVALESTIITHGMPYPENKQTALKMQSIIESQGAAAALIALVDGKIKIGMTEQELDDLAKAKDVIKVAAKDIPLVLARRKLGGTTVSATMRIANLCGINVFATGGIGGVHRGAQTTMDISSDLEELSRTPVTVVCSGAKSILDIKLTLEFLETKGVPVVGIGDTKDFPAFFTRSSGYALDHTVPDPTFVAQAMRFNELMGVKNGIVVANPVPKEYAMDEKIISDAIENAVKEAQEKGIKGKEVTPFLLSKIKDITAGKSLETNMQLAYSNADLAAKIAVGFVNIK
ncbi:MAG: pseudouridine-5'-phosphate glycosidase [Elusimicrobiota bacterium]|jgi:pseudouridine-5'-phosphate glycosidase|nr:pseudouridine-5'-phosphate glycosidase [Elusimicrobiota bacterium]